MSEVTLPIPPSGFEGGAGLDYENHLPVVTFKHDEVGAIYWQFEMFSDYSSGLSLTIIYTMAAATSGTIEFEGSVWAASEGESAAVESYDAINTVTETVPGTAGLTSKVTITFSNDDAVSAGDLVRIKVASDSDDATNYTATGLLYVRSVRLTYTAA